MPRGTLFLVVGPSGAGKDSLICEACRKRPDLYLMPRTITRPAEADEHTAVSEEKFAELKRDYAFSLSWDANGLRYGISRDMEARLEAGQSVIVNGSRSIVGDVLEKFDPTRVIYVTARLDVLSRRLRDRGRESGDEIDIRMARAGRSVPVGPDVIKIDNSDSFDESLAVFLEALA